jgi:glycosyltransferase involved in cell wall biosynthesis
MKLGIDASNIKSGGGLTHLSEILNSESVLSASKFEKIIVWGGASLSQLPSHNGLVEIRYQKLLNGSFISESFWKLFIFPKLVQESDIIFAPGGTFCSKRIRYISMSQNMLVFDKPERNRYPFYSWMRFRFIILNFLQKRSFNNSRGVIFLSNHAKNEVYKVCPDIPNSEIIHHGISPRFKQFPKIQSPIEQYESFNILYVSTIAVYKHHIPLIKAVKRLVSDYNLPLKLCLVGRGYKKQISKVKKEIEDVDFIHLYDEIPFSKIHETYRSSDLFVFSSTCENMPNILVEAMSAGLPIASSHSPPMPEFLLDSAVYFDPLNVEDILKTLLELIKNHTLRAQLAQKSYQLSLSYSWESCATKTFEYIANQAR